MSLDNTHVCAISGYMLGEASRTEGILIGEKRGIVFAEPDISGLFLDSDGRGWMITGIVI